MAAVTRDLVEQAVRAVLAEQLAGQQAALRVLQRPRLVVNTSARHVHVTPEVLERLFGPGAKLTPMRPLYQEGEFAADQTVAVFGPRQRVIPNVRILGPTRRYTQVELSFTDGIHLGIDLPVRPSGNHEGTPGCALAGPQGVVELHQGVIRAERHVHMHPQEAAYYGVKDGDYLRLRVDSACPVVLERLLCRVSEAVKLEVHLDTDEANACDLAHARRVELFV